MKKRALITGISGQDGSYLAEHLLGLNYDVYGIVRASTTRDCLPNVGHILSNVSIFEGDIADRTFVDRCLRIAKPHEVYNLAAQSHVGQSFEAPEMTMRTTGMAVLGLLEAIRTSGFNSKFYQASTSEMFGNSSSPQNELTPMMPVSPYGCAKLFAHHITRTYREAYNMFACSGILLNHESPRRGPNFVTQKVCRYVARLAHNQRCDVEKRVAMSQLRLGNMDARRDWGHARDYVRGMHMMMQHTRPDDFVLATGETHSVKELVRVAFSHVGLDYEKYVQVDTSLFRPIDVNALVGDPSKAKRLLGWAPMVTFEELIHEMVDSALQELT